ncbi:MAG: VOC family protein, partial [Chloroflexi bacterium]|nr:VOC family protein [Chloroflexota bacterium]
MIQGFATVTLWVKDFNKSIAFYRDILSLEMTSNPGEIPQFKVGEGFLVLAQGDFCPPADA